PDYFAASWHARCHDWHPSECRFEEHARDALAILRRKCEQVGKLQQRRHVRPRADRRDIRRMLVDLSLRNRQRALGFTRPDKDEACIWPLLADLSGSVQ